MVCNLLLSKDPMSQKQLLIDVSHYLIIDPGHFTEDSHTHCAGPVNVPPTPRFRDIFSPMANVALTTSLPYAMTLLSHPAYIITCYSKRSFACFLSESAFSALNIDARLE